MEADCIALDVSIDRIEDSMSLTTLMRSNKLAATGSLAFQSYYRT